MKNKSKISNRKQNKILKVFNHKKIKVNILLMKMKMMKDTKVYKDN